MALLVEIGRHLSCPLRRERLCKAKKALVVAYSFDDLVKGKENIRLIFEPKQSETVETVFLSTLEYTFNIWTT